MAKKQVNTYVPVPEAPPIRRRPTISFQIMNNSAPVPVARPADFVQLTPIIQPVALVPYSSQNQPMAMFDEDNV